MEMLTWITGSGTEQTSKVLARFSDGGVAYVVVGVGRTRYDAGEPYAVLKQASGTLHTVKRKPMHTVKRKPIQPPKWDGKTELRLWIYMNRKEISRWLNQRKPQ